MRKLVLFPIVLLSITSALAQPAQRTLEAKRTTKEIVIDGKLNEEAWKDAAIVNDFTEFKPVPGRKERPEIRTEAFIVYNNDGIYFGGTCYEPTRDSIQAELSGRDGFGINDYICIAFDTYYDKLNGFEYFITPLNEQWDAKITSSQNIASEDFSWNAVWVSAVEIHDKGWTFEIFLPYSAIRFSRQRLQNWGFNVTRRRRKAESQTVWNPVDPTLNGFITQEGVWKGVSNIKPPLRLQLYPYLSFYENHYPASQPGQQNWTKQLSGGLDMKLGLNQAFTLDVTLVPDFGQVQSDNQVLNLSPFEIRYNENRQFFTEGTELFMKGNLFYSRRIGGRPINLSAAYNAIGSNEKLMINPTESKLINATKLSGRTGSGLGVGILNAITRTQYAIIEDSITGKTRKFETDPATNYNILVLDQNLKYNSSVSFINTSVLRGGGEHNANVSAALLSLNDKHNMYNLRGNVAISHLDHKSKQGSSTGYSHSIGFNKTSGRFLFGFGQDLTDTRYSSNDLGYLTNSNFLNHNASAVYRVTQPKGWYNRMSFNLSAGINRLFKPVDDITTMYQDAKVSFSFTAQHKKMFSFSVYGSWKPSHNDFYEPRLYGWIFKRNNSLSMGSWIETNAAKKYSLYAEFADRRFFHFYNGNNSNIVINHGYRFNPRFSIRHSIEKNIQSNSVGFTKVLDNQNILFARRRVSIISNIINLKYSFTNKMGLAFRARYYSSIVENKDFYLLNKDGSLTPKNDITRNYNRNVNYFNIDMVYTWQFAPGSFVNLAWKNATVHSSDTADTGFWENLQKTLTANQNNNFSVKIIYFLDYLHLKKLRK